MTVGQVCVVCVCVCVCVCVQRRWSLCNRSATGATFPYLLLVGGSCPIRRRPVLCLLGNLTGVPEVSVHFFIQNSLPRLRGAVE